LSAETSVYWGHQFKKKLIVAPRSFAPELLARAEKVLKCEIQVIVPKLKTGFISRDLLLDTQLRTTLKRMLTGADVTLLSWGITPDFCELVSWLNNNLIEPPSCEWGRHPEPSFFDYVDSKVGGTCLLQYFESCHFKVPETFITKSLPKAEELATRLKDKLSWDFVLKPDIGWGGKSIIFTRKSGKPKSRNQVSSNDFLSESSVVVQRDVSLSDVDLTPSVDFFISEKGKVEVVVPDNMLAPGGNCSGVEIGEESLSPRLSNTLVIATRQIAVKLATLGYIGWGDVDFMVAGVGRHSIYVSEINARRTGGTAPVEILMRLRSITKPCPRYLKTWERLTIHSHTVQVTDIIDTIDHVEKVYKNQGVTILPFSLSGIVSRPAKFAYCILAESRTTALRAEKLFLRKLSTLGNLGG